MEDKVLVTGSNGQLGQCLKDVVSWVCKYKNNTSKYIFTTREDFDITNTEMMRNYLNEHKDIKVIINCAAYTNVKGAESEEGFKQAILVNRNSVKELAHLCKEFDIFLIHFGTDYMYNTEIIYNHTPINESLINWKLSPEWFELYYHYKGEINKYGYSKLLGVYEIFNEFSPKVDENCTKPKFIVIVVSWLYSQYGKNFVKTIRELVKQDKPIEVVYTQIGSPTYAMDLARYIIDVIENDDCCFVKSPDERFSYNVFDLSRGSYFHLINFTNLGVASWYDIAKVIEDVFSLSIDKVKPRKLPLDNVFRPEYSVLDTGKLLKMKDAEYVRHWLSALHECLSVIRLNEISEK